MAIEWVEVFLISEYEQQLYGALQKRKQQLEQVSGAIQKENMDVVIDRC